MELTVEQALNFKSSEQFNNGDMPILTPEYLMANYDPVQCGYNEIYRETSWGLRNRGRGPSARKCYEYDPYNLNRHRTGGCYPGDFSEAKILPDYLIRVINYQREAGLLTRKEAELSLRFCEHRPIENELKSYRTDPENYKFPGKPTLIPEQVAEPDEIDVRDILRSKVSKMGYNFYEIMDCAHMPIEHYLRCVYAPDCNMTPEDVRILRALLNKGPKAKLTLWEVWKELGLWNPEFDKTLNLNGRRRENEWLQEGELEIIKMRKNNGKT